MSETALTTTEQKELERLEAKIEHGVTGAKMALLEVRDQRLYRAKYGTFEAYCEQRWNITRRHGYRLLDEAEVLKEIAGADVTNLDTLPNEAQTRELTKLPKGERASAFEEAVETAPKKNGTPKVTAAHVQKVVAKRKAPEPAPVTDPTPSPAPTEPAKPALDPEPWAQHNADCRRVLEMMDEYVSLCERIASALPFGEWVEVTAHRKWASQTKTLFEKWIVDGFKPQWEIGKDQRNYFYAYETAKPKGGKK